MSQAVTRVLPYADTIPADLPTVTLVSSDGAIPAGLFPLSPRIVGANMAAVSPADDVAILYGDRSAPHIAQLRQRLGQRMPAVLVVGRVFDPGDISEAFDNGATGYLVAGEVPESFTADAVVRTARRQSCLSPGASAVLVARMRRAWGPDPAVGADLTARERQVMELLVAGHAIAGIADQLGISNKTVRNSLSRIYGKLGVRRQSEAILLWLGYHYNPPW